MEPGRVISLVQSMDHLLTWTIPPADREAVLGDLFEEDLSAAGVRRTCSLLGIAAYFHAEPYRDEDARVRALSLFVAALAILWAVPAAAGTPPPNSDFFSGPVLSVLGLLWTASYIPASAAAGLVVGHAPWLPDWAGHARWHATLALVGFAWVTAGSTLAGISAIGALLASAWFGDRARRSGPPISPSAG